LLDPGIHLLDLCRLFLGEPLLVQGVTAWRGFWKTGIEEDAQALLAGSTANASVDVSVVRWRSSFDLFALGSDGYGHVTGRGRSYGRQIYRRGPRWGWQAAPNQAASETVVVDDACEDSFARELAGCLKLEEPPVIPPADMLDGVAVMQLYALVRSHLPSSHGNPPVG
jgi:predicted dehydrogenase